MIAQQLYRGVHFTRLNASQNTHHERLLDYLFGGINKASERYMNIQFLQYTIDLIARAARIKNSAHKPKIILGLSGGPDSVFLLLLLKELQEKQLIIVHAAHLNHGWRENAHDDVNFCRALCEGWGIALTSEHAQNLEKNFKFNGSKEEYGRTLRRHFFEHVRVQEGADFIMLAHHLQDQQETFFLRMLRGTTLSGLCGMQEIAGAYLRPLLQVKKQEILDYLAQHSVAYCHDATNESDDFLRNRLRKYVLPAMQACDTRFDANFVRLMNNLKEDNDLLESLTKKTFETLFVSDELERRVARMTDFLALESRLQKRVLLHWFILEKLAFTPTNNFIGEVIRFLQNVAGGRHQLNPCWSIVKKKDIFWLEK